MKKAGLVGWVIIAVLILFGVVFTGLMGAAQAEKMGVNCTRSYGALCFGLDSNETVDRPGRVISDYLDLTNS